MTLGRNVLDVFTDPFTSPAGADADQEIIMLARAGESMRRSAFWSRVTPARMWRGEVVSNGERYCGNAVSGEIGVTR